VLERTGSRQALGYVIYIAAAVCFALNGSISAGIIDSGLDPTRLSQLRVTAAFAILLVFVAITNRSALRIRRAEIIPLLAFGILGVGMTQWMYFVALQYLDVGVALLIEFTAPILVALWFRFGWHQPTRALVWVGLGLALGGLALVGQVWKGLVFNGLGVLAAFGAAAALATYYVLGDVEVRRPEPRDPISLTMWGFGAAALFWAVVQPWWSFPVGDLAQASEPMGQAGWQLPVWALASWMVVMGTVVPFGLALTALKYIRASQASVIGMVEPLLAIFIAWVLLGQEMTPVQLAGAVLVLAGVVVTERSRT
jgi:drug/metabolite transporter (DMT)-like permease